MLAALSLIFPEKAAYVGDANLAELIGEARAEAPLTTSNPCGRRYCWSL